MANDSKDEVRVQRSFRSANRKIDQLSDRLNTVYKDIYINNPVDKNI